MLTPLRPSCKEFQSNDIFVYFVGFLNDHKNDGG